MNQDLKLKVALEWAERIGNGESYRQLAVNSARLFLIAGECRECREYLTKAMRKGEAAPDSQLGASLKIALGRLALLETESGAEKDFDEARILARRALKDADQAIKDAELYRCPARTISPIANASRRMRSRPASCWRRPSAARRV